MSAIHATINISVDGCCDHHQVIADDEFHCEICQLFERSAALIFGRNTYDLFRAYWPNIASDGAGSPGELRLARILDALPKYVVSRRPVEPEWKTQAVSGGIEVIRELSRHTEGMMLLVGSPALALSFAQCGLIDEYHIAISPMIAGHGPYFLADVERGLAGQLLSTRQLRSGVVIHRYSFNSGTMNSTQELHPEA